MRVEFFSAIANDATAALPSRIAVIGNAMPRRCGIATYTSHSVEALRARFPSIAIDHYAMDDGHGDVAYDASVRTIAQHDRSAYLDAAEAIEASGAELIWVQHEFGIFGGAAGDYLLSLLGRTGLPVVATLHTLLTAPSDDENRVFRALLARAGRLIVMAERGRDILVDHYGVDPATISVIPHGVPERMVLSADAAKQRLGLPQQPTVMTFGLLAPNKGIADMIGAMPAILAAVPHTLYYVLGATHPALKRQQGEGYREQLIACAERLGIAGSLRFVDRFFDEDELLDWLQAADVYVTPYTNPQQITSGALSYAVAMGKPVVSTPYVHAQEILADGHGVLVPFGDSAALARETLALLNDDAARTALAGRAWQRGQTMLWSANADAVAGVMAVALAACPVRLATARRVASWPVDLSAVERMTDGTGMAQHALHRVPDRRHGYCIDDNARALILMCRMAATERATAERLGTIYAAFVQHGWNQDDRVFRNFMGYNRTWLESAGSEDSNGRTLWALGVAAAQAPTRALRDWAADLFDTTLSVVETLGSPRAMAFAMLGAAAMIDARPGHARARAILQDGATMLASLVTVSRRPDWAWFEAVLAYDNARLPEALLRAGHVLGRQDWIDTGIETLAWIVEQQTAARGHFRAVGTDSFGAAYAPPRQFDQQPLEAWATVDACATAASIVRDARWAIEAERAFAWFTGDNDLALPVASTGDGGCFDGLMPHGVNRNQGAESILALQLAACTMAELARQAIPAGKAALLQQA